MEIDKGNAFAMCNLGLMLENGTGSAVDKREAARYYKMAADNGNTNGLKHYKNLTNT